MCGELPLSLPAFPLLPAVQVFLGLAYLGELVLLVFHLKGPHIEILLHLILALLVRGGGPTC